MVSLLSYLWCYILILLSYITQVMHWTIHNIILEEGCRFFSISFFTSHDYCTANCLGKLLPHGCCKFMFTLMEKSMRATGKMEQELAIQQINKCAQTTVCSEMLSSLIGAINKR